MKWKDEERNGNLNCSVTKAGRFKISIHRHVSYDPSQWLLSCNYLFSNFQLKSKDFEQAKLEALNVVKDELKKTLDDLNEA